MPPKRGRNTDVGSEPKRQKAQMDKKLATRLRAEKKKTNKARDAVKSAEVLLTEDAGFIETDGMERTHRLSQREITENVDARAANQVFSLKLDEFGPYRCAYDRNGRYMLLAGKRGHVAHIDSFAVDVKSELHLRETVRDVTYLHNHTMFAVAQKKYVYIYDKDGVEIHVLRQHVRPQRLEFLPYHMLLASVGDSGWLKYQDVSTGELVTEWRTKLGACNAMTQNPQNAVILCGHKTGAVTMWTPSVSTPVVKMACHKGPVLDMAVDRSGTYLVTTGVDAKVKVWDLRTYNEVHSYFSPIPATSVDISQRGVLATGFSSTVMTWKDALKTKQADPYIKHMIPGSQIEKVSFRPYEDVLGIGHASGFASLLVPGAGEPNFDTLEADPFMTTKQRREQEVHMLLDKIPSGMIALDAKEVGTVNPVAAAEARKEREEYQASKTKKGRLKTRTRGVDKTVRKTRVKNLNVITKQRALMREKAEADRSAPAAGPDDDRSMAEKLQRKKEAGAALARFV